MNPAEPVFPDTSIVLPHEHHGGDGYLTLPAVRLDGDEEELVTRWELTDEDRARIAAGGSVYLSVWTFGRRLQPVKLATTPPEVHVLTADGVVTVGGGE